MNPDVAAIESQVGPLIRWAHASSQDQAGIVYAVLAVEKRLEQLVILFDEANQQRDRRP